MVGWIIMLALIGIGLFAGAYLAARWGRGSFEGMSENMESESASYSNYTRIEG